LIMAKAKKAKKAKAKKRSARTIDVLDDLRWRPLIEAYKLLSPQAGLSTAFNLLAKLKSGKLPCVRRSATNPSQYEPVPAAFWRDRQFDESRIDLGLLDIYGPDEVTERGRFRDPHTRLDGREFYVWQPEKAWPALAPQAADASEAEASESLRRKPGRRPEKNWKLEVAVEVGLHRRAGKPIPTAKQLAQFCLDELGYLPDISHLQKWLRQLLD
jgi:hypothetical protein